MASITHWENSTRSQFTRALQLSVEERGGKRRCSASPSLLLWCAWPPSSEAWPDQTASPGGCKNISLWVATGPTRGAGDLGGGGVGGGTRFLLLVAGRAHENTVVLRQLSLIGPPPSQVAGGRSFMCPGMFIPRVPCLETCQRNFTSVRANLDFLRNLELEHPKSRVNVSGHSKDIF